VIWLAILAAKAIAVPLSPAFPPPELQYILNHSEALLLLSSAKFSSKAQEVLKTELDVQPTFVQLEKFQGGGPHEHVELEEKSDPGAAGMMLYTSGTTNRPVRMTHPHMLHRPFSRS
jgi:Acyl-CoA synthetases (AMP-forming)/AMP-acid ligases II